MSATIDNPGIEASKKFLHALIECSDDVQRCVLEMIDIARSSETDEDEKCMAIETIVDALFPNPYKGKYGMDLEESKRDAAGAFPELASIVEQMNAEEETFAERLRTAMDSHGISQAELAAKIGVGQPAISNMLNRECRPQQRTVQKLAMALGVAPEDLWPSQ